MPQFRVSGFLKRTELASTTARSEYQMPNCAPATPGEAVGCIINAAQDAKTEILVVCCCVHPDRRFSMEFGIWIQLICIVVIAAMVIYAPTVYIRKTNKMLKLLEQIEANTRK